MNMANPEVDASPAKPKPIVLHIGDPVKYNLELFERFSTDFTVIRPTLEERQRDAFITALKEKRWGEFSAILRPFWGTGGEMGRWDKELVPLLPSSVKVFASAGAGYDWADVDVLADHGIIYCNSGAACVESVADFTLFAILSTFRELTWLTEAGRSCSTDKFMECHDKAITTSHNPHGHTLGIIGFGKIGRRIAEKAYLAFGMKIIYYDIARQPHELEARVAAEFHADLASMLAASDCTVLATPGSPHGAKIITRATLAHFKRGSRFVNIARGGLVDEQALVEALQSGQVAGAMLDVHEHEPRVNPQLARMRGVALTCHNAGGTLETHAGFEKISMLNIDAVLNGREPSSAVNLHLMAMQG